MLDQLNKVQGGAVDEAVLDSAVLMKRWNAMQVFIMGDCSLERHAGYEPSPLFVTSLFVFRVWGDSTQLFS